jgi:NAD(P)-dependent dehydrogenase (short-subunit alcohol dehydrogenase family)
MAKSKDDAGLAGRLCVVTGGGSGIGRGIAVALAAEGAKVAIMDRNEAGAQETVRLVTQAGAEGLAVACDVAEPASIEAAHETIRKRFGDAHVLVNNAGILRPGALESLSLSDWNSLLSVNLTGYFICAQTFGRPMLAKREGALVHVSSITSECALPSSGAYSVAKAGVTMLSRLLAIEWGPNGVRSNVVHPGMIVTPLVQAVWDQPGVMEKRSAIIPSGRPGYPDDIGKAVVFLAGPQSSYVNGAELIVDGAFSRNIMSFVPRAGFGQQK